MKKKILLLGEYSSLYLNLQEGLRQLGHDAQIASFGDSWKNIDRNINLGNGKIDLFSKVFRKLSPIINIKDISGFDLVQFINPFYFYHPYLPNKAIFSLIKNNNDRFFLSAAGDDAYYWHIARKVLRYGPYDDFLKYDLQSTHFFMNTKKAFEYNSWVLDQSNGIIPIMYEYELGYAHHEKILPTIPIGVNIDKIQFSENKPSNKIVIFHGLNRYGFKGTRFVEEAFEKLRNRYPNDLELIIDGKMPLKEYLNVLKKTNVVIDQTNSYSLGVNGVYSIALGKVVLGGAEPESLKSLGVSTSPVVNILPSAESIYDKISNLLDQRSKIPEWGYQSRLFAEENHNYIKLANKYLKAWGY